MMVGPVEHELLEAPITVYNFEVEDFHTYYVGDTSVLVHTVAYEIEYHVDGYLYALGYDYFFKRNITTWLFPKSQLKNTAVWPT